MSEREDLTHPMEDPPAPGQSKEPQELPAANPPPDRDDDAPDDGPLGPLGKDESGELEMEQTLHDGPPSGHPEGFGVDTPNPALDEGLIDG